MYSLITSLIWGSLGQIAGEEASRQLLGHLKSPSNVGGPGSVPGGILAGFFLPYLLATTVLDAFSLF